jgi:hypothetical protein
MSIISQILQSESELSKLLGNPAESFVGYVYSLRFKEAFVMVHDKWKNDVNGIPHNSFLVATGMDPINLAAADPIDREIVLLRVIEPASLPQDSDLMTARLEQHQRRSEGERFPNEIHDGMDPITASELSFGGLKCNVLGTFFIDDGRLRLGSDIENYMTLSKLRAYKPRAEALAMIVNHINPEVKAKTEEDSRKAGFTSTPVPIHIGSVRYTSTARLHRGPNEPLVKVLIQPADFLARRTAVLGMTRTGKSNTVKTTVSAVALAALKSDIKIGQLIFDINGEYANATTNDDDSSIASVFESTVRYRAIDTPPEKNFKDLRINFYEQPNIALGLLNELSQDTRGSAQDITTFLTSPLDEPDINESRSAHTRWQVRKAAFFCVLHAAGYKAPANFVVEFPLSGAVSTAVRAELPANFPANVIRGNNLQFVRVNLDQATLWFRAARQVNLATPLPGSSAPWVDSSLESTLNVLCNASSGGTYIRGYRQLQEYVAYHSPVRQGDVVKEILDFLYQGKIVILDLSAGPVSVRKTLSLRIALSIFNRQFDTLNRGDRPMDIVLYVEEAHNLIGKDAKLDETWPRIAKEGAKARIAFVYATQEPSSVHANILANTENWFVTHLNNDDELKTLSKFYDFKDFAPSLKSSQDVGFARIKTLSSPFVIPTQIEKFDPASIKAQILAIQQSQEK